MEAGSSSAVIVCADLDISFPSLPSDKPCSSLDGEKKIITFRVYKNNTNKKVMVKLSEIDYYM